jgi:hypothetical protein
MRDVSGWPLERQIEYHAARRIWKNRDQMTPSGTTTWARWFTRRFGRTLDEASREFTEAPF